MSRYIPLAGWTGQCRATAVFVHGLGGHAYATWRRGTDETGFWPLWLARDVPGLTVSALAYEAPASNWLGTGMALPDRAVNVLECLRTSLGGGTAPIVFICHSLGGLIVKQLLLDLARQQAARPELAALLARVAGVVFLATPHAGARQATWLDRLRLLAWPSAIAQTLVANDPALRKINVDYRGLAAERQAMLQHLTFYEGRPTAAGLIVDESSADAGLPGRPPIPVDADHVMIAKPLDRDPVLYANSRDFVAGLLPPATDPGSFEVFTRPEVNLDRARNLLPKIVRLALIALLLLVLFKGVQTLIAPPAPDPAMVAMIVQQVLAKSGQPPAPGQAQAVTQAVTAAAQGAAAGDARLQQALALLQAGKIAEARAVFAAVAADKEAQSRQDSKDAAAAYRNLGAIAGLGDPKAALDAYAKAVQLDPDDIESLNQLAYLQADRGNLADAETHYRHVLDLTADDRNPSARYWALSGLGDIRQQRGNLPEALRAYRDGQAIAGRLAQSDPGNAGWQRDLSVSDNKIGDVLVAQGNLPEALRAYRDGQAIRARLAQSDPGNAGWQRDLSVSDDRIGDVLVAQGNLPEALRAYRDGQAIAGRLAQSDPGNAGWQRDLALSDDRIGDVLQKTGDTAQAAQVLRDGRAIMLRMTALSPDNAQWKQDLAWFDAHIAALAAAPAGKTNPPRPTP